MLTRHLFRITTSMLVLVTLLAAAGAGIVPAAAQDADPGFTVKAEPGADPATTAQGYFVYPLDAGERVSGQLRLSNPTDEPITVGLAAVDAMTASNGGSAFPTDEVEPEAVGTWVRLADTEVTIKPGKDLLVDFEVLVPKDAEPGQYLAGLSAAARPEPFDATPGASDATPDASEAGASIDLRTRYVIGVQVDVAGDWEPSLDITDVRLIEQPSGPVIGIGLRNDGATFLQPTGTLLVTDAAGTTVVEADIAMGTFVTGTDVVYPVSWQGVLEPGTYRAVVKLAYGDDQTVEYDEDLLIGAAATAAGAITIPEVDVVAVRDEATGDVQFANVTVTVENPGATVSNARLTLRVARDGEPVEDFSLGSALTFSQGSAQIQQRYLPPTGWETGTYTFEVILETVDPATGATTTLTTLQSETPLVVE